MSTTNIEHVVVLMLENRSFDSLLGWLYESDTPSLTIPTAAKGDEFRGLAHIDRNAFVNTALQGALSSPPVRGVAGFTVPTPDPGEEFAHVNTQFFGTPTPAPDAVPTMTGVLEDYVEVMKELSYGDSDIAARATSIMQSYTPAQLPVLNQLAKHYAVGDAWFASVPSQTNPNRAFAMCGTSSGLVNNGELEQDPRAKAIEDILGMGIGDDRFPGRTIFNALHDGQRDWKVFWQTSYLPQKISKLLAAASSLPSALLGPLKLLLDELAPYSDYLTELSSGELASNYTWRLFPEIQKIDGAAGHFAGIGDFHSMARAGTLPAFSYIEPFWTISQCGADTSVKRLFTAMGNDYHPPCNMMVGEDFVRDVYASLIANGDAWQRTVLLITFDEFVGSFDHVTPPAAVPPWGANGQPDHISPTGFKFDRLGARVPAIVVSPFVQKGTVFRSPTDVAYDHTSILATTIKMFGLSEPASDFGERAAAAPTFDDVLVLDEPRTDAADVAFLNMARNTGDPVRYGDVFTLAYQDGQYLGRFETAAKAATLPSSALPFGVDLGLAANFPKLGGASNKAVLTLATTNPDGGAVGDGDQVWIVSKEPGLVGGNVLGAWSDSHDCYWFDLYFDGEHAAQQAWVIQNVDHAGAALRYGDRIRLVNRSYGQRLSQDGRLFQGKWISTSKNDGTWTIHPAP